MPCWASSTSETRTGPRRLSSSRSSAAARLDTFPKIFSFRSSLADLSANTSWSVATSLFLEDEEVLLEVVRQGLVDAVERFEELLARLSVEALDEVGRRLKARQVATAVVPEGLDLRLELLLDLLDDRLGNRRQLGHPDDHIGLLLRRHSLDKLRRADRVKEGQYDGQGLRLLVLEERHDRRQVEGRQRRHRTVGSLPVIPELRHLALPKRLAGKATEIGA